MICTKYSTIWCQQCGECGCSRGGDGRPFYDNVKCPLHGIGATHADNQALVQAESLIDEMAQRQDMNLTGHDHAAVSRFAQMLKERAEPTASG